MNRLETIDKIIEGHQIRSVWDSEKEDYYFSVVDVINALAEPKDASDYWTTLKRRLSKDEKSQLPTKCRELKLKSLKDGKYYLTDVLDTNGILRLIESIPSPKAEPFKLWLANLGEVSTRDIAINERPKGLNENMKVAKEEAIFLKLQKNYMKKKLLIE